MGSAEAEGAPSTSWATAGDNRLRANARTSSSVGTYAGSVILEGFWKRHVPLGVRRVITLFPALVILAIGIDPSRALVLSQVVLSFGIPFALIPLVRLTSNRELMGAVGRAC